ncbi:MAG: hypothetical protein GY724_04585, partial [Actinomycetia bacterium]|nr:hypothetical protein [Actinomycetes bacterium]MCP5033340.1 hypothetical protein [Actinomycetes bacterium]
GDKPKGTPGSGEKSNLGTTADGSERLVVDYLIMKDLNKDKPKTCGSAVLVPAGGFPGLMVVMAGAAGALAVGTVWNRRRRTAPLPV